MDKLIIDKKNVGFVHLANNQKLSELIIKIKSTYDPNFIYFKNEIKLLINQIKLYKLNLKIKLKIGRDLIEVKNLKILNVSLIKSLSNRYPNLLPITLFVIACFATSVLNFVSKITIQSNQKSISKYST